MIIINIYKWCNIDHMRYLSDVIVIVTCDTFTWNVYQLLYLSHVISPYICDIHFMRYIHQSDSTRGDIVIVKPNPINFLDDVCCSFHYFEIIKHLTAICQIWSWCDLFERNISRRFQPLLTLPYQTGCLTHCGGGGGRLKKVTWRHPSVWWWLKNAYTDTFHRTLPYRCLEVVVHY